MRTVYLVFLIIYADNEEVLNDINGAGSNAQNYAVIYKFKANGFSGTKAVFELNQFTHPSYSVYRYACIYMAYYVQDGNAAKRESQVLLNPQQYPKYSTEFIVNFNEIKINKDSFDFYVVVSGMSSMPLTLRFE